MLSPLSMFCCGCTVPMGVGTILFFHLASNCAYIFSAVSNLIFLNPVFASSWTVPLQMLYTAFCLVGLPVVGLAAFGLANRVEINIRLYLYYFLISFLIDTSALGYWLAVEEPCNMLDGLGASFSAAARAEFGDAFLCGFFRIASYFVVSGAVLTEVYCLWVVWSFAEDVHLGMNGPELSQLLPGREGAFVKHKIMEDGPAGGIVGFHNSKLPGPYPTPYGAISTSGDNGLFGFENHETEYPPRSMF
mmetsp:Transcript_81636/g.214296  ORF Transcript_81636/g.214296 Transcript_81636/m.214296 type:complete len:247 (-) Transcript_81636:33-773(-)